MHEALWVVITVVAVTAAVIEEYLRIKNRAKNKKRSGRQ